MIVNKEAKIRIFFCSLAFFVGIIFSPTGAIFCIPLPLETIKQI